MIKIKYKIILEKQFDSKKHKKHYVKEREKYNLAKNNQTQ